tara:strand:+ start:91 stop:405 length:315 start_codon:yes stop_codon:yes gene_type:complete
MSKFYNITGSTGVTVELIPPAEAADVKSVLITNVHATADATVTLFIEDDPTSGTTSTHNLIHTIAVPANSSLLLDNPFMFRFSNTFGLYTTVGSSDTVDIMVSI